MKRWNSLLAIAVLTTGLSSQALAQNQPKSAGTFPKCTDPLPTVAVPNGPHGLFAIMFPDVQKQAKYNLLLLHNPVVCGANFYLVWNQIDRGPDAYPRYDWSQIDERI